MLSLLSFVLYFDQRSLCLAEKKIRRPKIWGNRQTGSLSPEAKVLGTKVTWPVWAYVLYFLACEDSLICSHFNVIMRRSASPAPACSALSSSSKSSLWVVLTGGPCDLPMRSNHLKDHLLALLCDHHSFHLHPPCRVLMSGGSWIFFGCRIIHQHKSL